MTAGLWALASGMPPEAVAAAVPPTCRGAVMAAATPAPAGDETLIEGPPWPAIGATHFVPSFCALTDAPYSVRLEVSARVGEGWTPWAACASLGTAAFTPLPPGPLQVDVDQVRAPAPAAAVRLRARLRAPGTLAAPWLLALSAAGPGDPPPATAGPLPARLDVPALSQQDAAPAIAPRICSPTCVAMVLAYWRRPVEPGVLAAEIYHPGEDLYGVWPAAIVAAGRRGLAGYLLRFPDWDSAAWCLRQGLPVIASVRYATGELRGAAIAGTAGHLLVLTGFEGDEVLVNDPAAPGPTVRRRYPLEDLARVWLGRTGMGYVLFPLSGARGAPRAATGG